MSESWVGGTRGWTRYTSRWRQFARSWAWRQSLLNRLISVSERVTPSSSQIRWARSVWADPENTTTSRMSSGYPPRARR